MSYPSGFGLLAVYPGIADNPPGFSFYTTGGAGIIQQWLMSATGAPQLLFSVFTGERPPLDYVSGLSNSFNFNQGIMHFGTNFNKTYSEIGKTGALNLFWDANNTSSAGLVITQRNSVFSSGGPALSLRERVNTAGFGFDYSVFVGGEAHLPNFGSSTKVVKSFPDNTVFHIPTVYASATFEDAEEFGNDYFNGFIFGRWDGVDTLYGNLGAYQDYTEIGHFPVNETRPNLGGLGALVLRNALADPTTYHPSGTTLFTKSNGTLNLITSQNQKLELAPGITGVNKYAHSTGIYEEIVFSVSNSGLITNDYDGKILISEADDTYGSTYSIYLHGALRNGFSCEVITNTNIPGFFRGLGTNDLYGNDVASDPFGRQKVPKGVSRTFISKRGDKVYITNVEETSREFYVPASQFHPSFVSGATGSYHYNSISDSTYQCFDFHDTGSLSIETDIVIPREWNNSIKCGILYAGISGAAGAYTIWNIKTKNASDSSFLSSAFINNVGITSITTTSGRIVETFTTGFVPFSTFSSDVGTRVHLKLTRDPLDVSDNLAATAKFLGMFVQEE